MPHDHKGIKSYGCSDGNLRRGEQGVGSRNCLYVQLAAWAKLVAYQVASPGEWGLLSRWI